MNLRKKLSSVVNLRDLSVEQYSMDELWHMAEQIGDVSVEKSIIGDMHKAQIRFNNHGSRIYAEAKHHSAAEALRRSLAEAIRLGGQP